MWFLCMYVCFIMCLQVRGGVTHCAGHWTAINTHIHISGAASWPNLHVCGSWRPEDAEETRRTRKVCAAGPQLASNPESSWHQRAALLFVFLLQTAFFFFSGHKLDISDGPILLETKKKTLLLRPAHSPFLHTHTHTRTLMHGCTFFPTGGFPGLYLTEHTVSS